jgi:lipoate-protein ligase A
MRNLKMEQWFFLQSGRCQAAYNMALDEALLETMPRLRRPVLRFYGWSESAGSFGYFQKYEEIQRMTTLRPLVRRPTAGGLVPHDSDWTYSLTLPSDHPWHSLRAEQSYHRMHEWICASFARLGISAAIAAMGKKTSPGQCFAGFERFDLLYQGKKIAGAAQRRNKTGLLIQGSIQPNPGWKVSRGDWQEALFGAAVDRLAVEWIDFQLDQKLEQRVNDLVREKYSKTSYNQKR